MRLRIEVRYLSFLESLNLIFLILSQNKNPNIVKLVLGTGGNIMGNVYGYVQV